MRLPPYINHPAVEAVIANAKEAFDCHAFECVELVKEKVGSAIGAGAISMVGLLDAALEHFAVWHGAQDLPFDEEQFLAFVRERFKLAGANAAGYLAGNRRALQ
ncbi:MAG: hypothetical protein ACRDBL_09210 [Rhabdaerophilum sp.]